MAAKYGPDVLFCMPNRTKCILMVSLTHIQTPEAAAPNRRWTDQSDSRLAGCLQTLWSAGDP
jgi:hypothetical protein